MPELPTSTAHPWPVLNPRSTYIFVPRPDDLFGGESITGGFDPYPGSPGYTGRPDQRDGILNSQSPNSDAMGVDRAGQLHRNRGAR